MGSEMVIRDSRGMGSILSPPLRFLAASLALWLPPLLWLIFGVGLHTFAEEGPDCLLYTSDAADERSSVDLGGRRIIKNKTKKTKRKRINAKSAKRYMSNIRYADTRQVESERDIHHNSKDIMRKYRRKRRDVR